MSFPRYPEYKDSGVEWLGDVPGHWGAVPIKHLGRLKGGAGFPHERQGIEGEELSFHKVNALAQADSDGFLTDSENTIDRATAKELGAFVFPAGSIVFAKVGAALLLARIRLLSQNACLDNNMMGLVVRQDEFAVCFVRYAMNLVRFDLIANPGAVPSLNEGQIGEFRLAMPPLPEQTQIAAFLDRETAKIDALVAEQRRLMALLKEKRQVVISHAVTRGLNPHAPLKPSGIEWLGDVPAHWEVGPLKRFWSVTDCKHVTAEFVDDGIPLASIREVQSRWITLEGAKCTTEHFYEMLIEGGRQPLQGDLIFSRNATVGEVAQVHADHPRFAMGQDVVLLRKLSPSDSSDYMQHVIRSPIIVLQLANMMIGSTFKRINVEEIRSFLMPSPPPSEQAEIATFLETESAKFDTLAAEAQRAIDLLQERRTALISAAVTGQIDVRQAE